MRKVPLAPDVEPRVIARGTPGFSGADLANLVNEAALLAARKTKRVVTMAEFEEAKDKVMMGAERRSMVMTDEERQTDRVSRGGTRTGWPSRAGQRSIAQSDHHPTRPCLGPDDEPAGTRSLRLYRQGIEGAVGDDVRWPHGRGDRLRQGKRHHRCRQRHPASDFDGAQNGDRMGHERKARPAALRGKPRRGCFSATRWPGRKVCRIPQRV